VVIPKFCGWVGPFKQIDDHLAVCMFEPGKPYHKTSCPYCAESMVHQDLKKHMEVNPNS
jgi:DNA-binding helix-hairpin-helix protein with protein kinase domain